MNPKRVKAILERLPRQTLLVVGDVMLDQFIWGKVSRVSPEAPVPVVEVTSQEYFPGGAANVARNLRALGVPVKILGVLGDDLPGLDLRKNLNDRGVDTQGLIVDASRPTTVKTRIVAHRQQVVRFDQERTNPIAPVIAGKMLEYFRAQLPHIGAVIFEDYGKGLMSQDLFNRMNRAARQKKKITSADPNSRHPLRFSELTTITPNRAEAFAAAGRAYTEPSDDVMRDKPLREVGEILLRKWKPRHLLITLGEHGMVLFQKGKKPHHIPTVAQEVFDVSGAGDTVIATLTAALVSGASAVEAAVISNHAAGVVVGKVGTATCSVEELIQSFKRNG